MPLSEPVYCVAASFKMTELEHSSMETIWMIQKALGEDAMRAEQIKLWHKCFNDGQVS